MERKDSQIIEGYDFKADDYNNLYYSANEWPENYYVSKETEGFQAVAEGEFLGNYEYAENAISELNNWIVENQMTTEE